MWEAEDQASKNYLVLNKLHKFLDVIFTGGGFMKIQRI